MTSFCHLLQFLAIGVYVILWRALIREYREFARCAGRLGVSVASGCGAGAGLLSALSGRSVGDPMFILEAPIYKRTESLTRTTTLTRRR
jgi:hypothetical protein